MVKDPKKDKITGMRGNGKTEWKMGWGQRWLVKINIMENGYKTKSKEKEFYLKIMGIFMMEIGTMISLMVKEYSSSKMGKNMMVKS